MLFANCVSDKGIYSEHIKKNSLNLTIGNQATQLENGQNTWTDTSPKNIHTAGKGT